MVCFLQREYTPVRRGLSAHQVEAVPEDSFDDDEYVCHHGIYCHARLKGFDG